MKLTLLTAAFSSLLCTANGSPLQKRKATNCLTYSGTSVYLVTATGLSCPMVTPPPAADLTTVSATEPLEQCFYPTTLNYAQMGSTALMFSMSSLATAIYNAQKSGAVVCEATKTANLPSPLMSYASVTEEPVSEITVEVRR